ncbi:alpha/beta hydrolase [Hydrogenophaga sp. PML113]|uniref:alpha/beta hydrolase n=1 Tax=Hydrogenophaga sp. PML113 TaxID=1899350 RepID=UPI001113144A|nr:alpha/beta hydrolase [Hydrogenophaga sp. PML113]
MPGVSLRAKPWRGLPRTAAALLLACAGAAAAAPSALAAPDGPSAALRAPWSRVDLPGSAPGRRVPVLRREASPDAAAPRVVVVPGSGCAGLGPIAPAYFAGLERAQVWVLHKPLTNPWVRTAPDGCGEAFARDDRPTRWQADALAALQALRASEPERPTWLVGISEGGDLLPALGQALGTSLRGLVLLSASGLDPAETLRLQAQRIGRPEAWAEIRAAAASARSDDDLVHGRSLGHWRDLLAWRLFEPLTAPVWAVWQWWGDADELIPAEAYERFGREAVARPARLCVRRWPGADHGLNRPGAGPAQPALWLALLAATEADDAGCGLP